MNQDTKKARWQDALTSCLAERGVSEDRRNARVRSTHQLESMGAKTGHEIKGKQAGEVHSRAGGRA